MPRSLVSDDRTAVRPLSPSVPRWVVELIGRPPSRSGAAGEVDITSDGSVSVFSSTVPAAVALGADELRAAVAAAYSAIGTAVTDAGRQPIRFWNFLPFPGDRMGAGIDRYMVFNAGRYDAYARRYGTFSHSLATASAVGVQSADLVIYCLASTDGGRAVENPRQTSSWQYSARYGPKPPCFARATIARIRGVERLLIGGTASIVGEDSVHLGDRDRQVDETLRNIRALIGTARNQLGLEADAGLRSVTHLRVYVRNAADVAAVLQRIEESCEPAVNVEGAISAVCRPELLVEVEGVAAL